MPANRKPKPTQVQLKAYEILRDNKVLKELINNSVKSIQSAEINDADYNNIGYLNSIKYLSEVQIELPVNLNDISTRANEDTDCLGSTSENSDCGATSVYKGCGATEHETCKKAVLDEKSNLLNLKIEIIYPQIYRYIKE